MSHWLFGSAATPRGTASGVNAALLCFQVLVVVVSRALSVPVNAIIVITISWPLTELIDVDSILFSNDSTIIVSIICLYHHVAGGHVTRLKVSNDGLTIQNVTLSDTSSIQCRASNGYGRLLSSVYLNVYGKR